MRVRFHPRFTKQLAKLPVGQQRAFHARLGQFLENPAQPLLRKHRLAGKLQGYWSINITGDIRALYQSVGKDLALFTHIGTHSELYD